MDSGPALPLDEGQGDDRAGEELTGTDLDRDGRAVVDVGWQERERDAVAQYRAEVAAGSRCITRLQTTGG